MLPDQVSSPLRNRDYRDVTRDILHTRTLLDFAAGYGYLDQEEAIGSKQRTESCSMHTQALISLPNLLT